MVSEKDSV